MATVYDAAQYINDQFGNLTKVKLQKLLYFCQAWHLAKYDAPLFDEDFYAWKLGPVVKELHESMHSVETFVPYDIAGSNVDNLNNGEIIFIDKVLDCYGDKNKDELVAMTHEDDAWKNAMPDALITKESIKSCYKAKPCPIR